MIDPTNVPSVADDELLARFIYQSSHIRASDGTVKPNAFLPPANLLASVTRHLQATEIELWNVGAQIALERQATLEYELDKNEMKAADRLRRRVPDAQIWLVHVTRGYLHRFGGQGLRDKA